MSNSNQDKHLLDSNYTNENILQQCFQKIYESNMLGVGLWGPDGQVFNANDAYLTLIGHSRDDLKNNRINWKALTPPEYLPLDNRAIEQILIEGRCVPYEKEYALLDGRRVSVIIGGAIVNRDPIIGIAFALDITKLKKAENDLRESERKFRILFEDSILGIFRTTPDGKYLDMNPAFARLYGFKSPEEMKNEIYDIGSQLYVHPEDRERIKQILSTVGEVHGFEVENRHRKGYSIWISINAKTVRDKNGEILCYEGTVENITARKRMEEEKEKLQIQLVHSQKMESIGRLAGGVAHDFNNMLQIILGYVELAIDEGISSVSILESLQEIQKAAKHSASLVRQLLAFARKQTVNPKILNLNDTIDSLLKMLSRLIGENISISWIPDIDVWMIWMDPSQIDQILANLCLNARDAISGTGNISIKTKNIEFENAVANTLFPPGKYVMLTVSDNGCGMAKDVIDHIFEPFFTTKVVGAGTGLGLATVYGIVKQNNGFISVDSELGKGTTFKIYFPIYVEGIQQTEENSILKRQKGQGETILLVEDEIAILNLTKSTLENLGYRVLAVDSPGKAIQEAEQHADKIRLLVTDMIMPEMNGKDLAKKIQSINPKIKCIFMSGFMADTQNEVIEEKFHFLQKPFSSKDIAWKLYDALGKR